MFDYVNIFASMPIPTSASFQSAFRQTIEG